MTVPFRLVAVAILCCIPLQGGLSSETRTAREALGLLKVGNDRFARNASAPVSLSPLTRQQLAKGQQPFAMVLSCADSRVPPEHIFNVGLGDLFVIRAAGEVVDRSILASLEYGAEHLHIPLLVVMGHESCGAVQAATAETAEAHTPSIEYLVKAIRAGITRSNAERTELRTAILANVEQSINDALSGSPLLRAMVDTRRLEVVGAYYELASGRVLFSEPATSRPANVPVSSNPVAQPAAPKPAAAPATAKPAPPSAKPGDAAGH